MLQHLAVMKGVQQGRTQGDGRGDSKSDQSLGRAEKALNTYSSGMKQRFGIAQALLGDVFVYRGCA
jgi:ABC-type Na+ transport system ATPase subunit NatA